MIAAAEEGLSRQVSPKRMTEGSTSKPTWGECAFEELFLEHYARIVAVLFRLLGDRAQAEELANDVFWKLYRQPVPRHTNDNPSGWLYRTATNLGIDALRAAARRKQYERAAGRSMQGASTGVDPLDEVLRAEKHERVRAVLASVKPAQAQILILRASGFSYKELADFLGAKLGGIGTMLNRAEAEFRKRYLRLYKNEEDL